MGRFPVAAGAITLALIVAGCGSPSTASNHTPAHASANGIGTITTIAGAGAAGPNGSVGAYPAGLAILGNQLYVADPNASVVRVLDLKTGEGRVVAGDGSLGDSGDGGAATQAQLERPFALAITAAGTLLIADQVANRVRAVTPDGRIHTVAGTGNQLDPRPVRGGEAATTIDLEGPTSLAVSPAGDLYILDGRGVWRVDATGTINQITRETGLGIAIDGKQHLYLAKGEPAVVTEVRPDGGSSVVAGRGPSGFAGDGGPATSATLSYPTSLAVDNAGDLFIGDLVIGDGARVRKVDALGRITTIAGTGTAGFAGDGGHAVNAQFRNAESLVVDSAGTLYIADTDNGRVRAIGADGMVRSLGATNGDGGPALNAVIAGPVGLAVDLKQQLFVAERDGQRIRRIDAGGQITTVAGNGIDGYSGDGRSAVEAELNQPVAVAVDASGDLFIADSKNNRVRRVDAGGIITTVAGNGSAGFSGDGGPAGKASLNTPYGLALDRDGNLFVADAQNNCVRRVDGKGVITTVAGRCSASGGFSGDGGLATAAQLSLPMGLAIDGSGNLLIADSGNRRIRVVDTQGRIKTAAGGQQEFLLPVAIALDTSGNAYIADLLGQRVQRDDTQGAIETVAGAGPVSLSGGSYAGDGGPATSARLNNPGGVVISPKGNLLIADTENGRIREVLLHP